MNGQLLVILAILMGGGASFLIYEHYQPNDNNAALSVEGVNTENNISAAALSNQLKEGAPVQNAIKQAVSNGTLSLQDMNGTPEYSSQILENNKTNIKIQYTTKLKFKNPKGAGISADKWPKFQISNPNGTSEELDQKIKDSISSDIQKMTNATERAEINDAWNNYNFDSGERVYEINETYDGTYNNNSNNTINKGLPVEDPPGTYYYSILMGFTEGINWKYNKEENLYFQIGWWRTRVAWFRADIYLDSAIGLRLPTKVGLNIPNQMINGQSYTFSTNVIGEDWNANQYSLANVRPENGNEFVSRLNFMMSVMAWTSVTGNIGPYNYNKNLDYGQSFKTPFGSDKNEKFPLPVLERSPDQTNLKVYPMNGFIWLGVGLKIEPILGSDKITANWVAEGSTNGNGVIEYGNPDKNYEFGPVKVDNNDNEKAIIKLSDFNYYLSVCKIDLDANVQGGLTVMPLTIKSPYITIYSYNCGGMTNDFHLGIHRGTNANNASAYIDISRVMVPLANASNASENVSPTIASNGTINTTETPTMAYSIANSNGTINTTETPSPTDTIVNTTETPSPTDTIVNTTETPSPTDTIVNTTETPSPSPTVTTPIEPSPSPTDTIVNTTETPSPSPTVTTPIEPSPSPSPSPTVTTPIEPSPSPSPTARGNVAVGG